MCRIDHKLPEGEAISLPTAFHINSFLDLQKKLTSSKIASPNDQKAQQQSPQPAATAPPICLEHSDPLKVFCETCSRVICCECAITREHMSHDFHLISECYPKHLQQLKQSVYQIKQEMANIDVAESRLDDREKEVLQQGERLTEEINTHAQKMIDQIERSRIRLSQKVDTIVQQKTTFLKKQTEQAQKLRNRFKICQEMIEQSLEEWNKQRILKEKRKMMETMKAAGSHRDSTFFEPIEKADIEFTIIENQKEIGTISSTTYSEATLKVPPCFAEESYTATLSLQSQDSSPFPLPPSLISSSLSSPSDDEVSVKCNVTQTNPGEYNITFTPTVTRGEQLLTVQVGGVDIPNSPFTLPVIPQPEMRERPVKIIEGLKKPRGVGVLKNGDIVIAEYTVHRLTILNKNGKKLKSIGKSRRSERLFNYPRGVAISNDGHILVTDNHRLQKLTTDGVCVHSVGSGNRGNGSLEFDWPRGIAVHPTTGEIFVADYNNDRIQVFNGADLSFSHTIAHKKLKQPYDLAVDKDDCLYTTECGSNSISKYTTKGQYIKRIVSLGVGTKFVFLAVNSFVYMSNSSDGCISVYDTAGNLLHSFGKSAAYVREGKATQLRDVTVDASGNLYASDFAHNRVFVY